MPLATRKTRVYVLAAALSYLALSVVLWWHAWTGGVSTHTLCGCGDPALFLWFFQWPATAVAHGHNPFFATALFHPGGVNLLAQTSVLGLSIPLIPVTWLFGPVASLNVACTLCPALSAFFAFLVLRRWVRWLPAAFAGGLLFGFSPFVLSSLQFAHLMTAAIMLLPLVLAVLDDIVIRQRHDPRLLGVALGLLLFAQFFLSSELLAVMALLAFLGLVAVLVAALIGARERLRQTWRRAAEGLGVALAVGAVLLAYPVWFALAGPAHLSGLIWPNIGAIGGYVGSSFVSPDFIHGSDVYTALGGYEGSVLPSSGYLGWGLLAVVGAGTLVWFRQRVLWFFAFLLALCMICSLGERRGGLEPSRLFAHLPLLENVIEQRFMAIGFLAAAAALAVVIDRTRADLPGLVSRVATTTGAGLRTGLGIAAGLGVAAVALVPIVTTFAPSLPFTMEKVLLPRWYRTVAPSLPPGKVVLSYPTPFSGIQVAMSWQAVDRMSYSQAGGGGPQGVANRAGSASKGFVLLARLGFGVGVPQPTTNAAQLGAVRHALSVWGVNTVVVAPDAAAPALQQGHDPTYAAAFMTAVLGRMPVIQAGAWVWSGSTGAAPALHLSETDLDLCTLASDTRYGQTNAHLTVARCVMDQARRS